MVSFLVLKKINVRGFLVREKRENENKNRCKRWKIEHTVIILLNINGLKTPIESQFPSWLSG